MDSFFFLNTDFQFKIILKENEEKNHSFKTTVIKMMYWWNNFLMWSWSIWKYDT